MGFLHFIYCQCSCCIAQARYLTAFFCFWGVLLGYCQRSSLAIGIVEMVEHEEKNSTCPNSVSSGPTDIKNIVGGKVNWSEAEQGYNLAAFFAGYLISHIPAGILCDKYGPRCPLLVGYILSTVTTGLIPLGATVIESWWLVFILRFITGIGQGSLMPGIASLVSRWIPPHERTTIAAAIFAATSFGLCIGQVGTGLLIAKMQNWPLGFYLWAGIGAIYCVLSGIYVFSDPRTHPHIHPSELYYLQSMMNFKSEIKAPWKKILAEKSMYGILFVQMGHDLIIYTLSNNFPKYLNQVLGFPILENGLVSFIFLLLWLSSFLTGLLADYLIIEKNVNVSLLRKSYTVISNIAAFLFFLGAVLSECNAFLAIGMFAIGVAFKGIFFAGGKVNIVDISLNHSGLIMSIVNGISAIMGFLASYLVGVLAPNNTFPEWRNVSYVIGAVQVVTLMLYLLMSNANRCDWDYAEGEQKNPKPFSWYKQLSQEDFEQKKVKDAAAKNERIKQAKEAKERMKQGV